MGEALLAHKGADQRAFLRTEGQRVALLLQLVQWFYLVDQVVWWEVVQLVRRLGITKDYYEWSVEELRAVNFDLIGKCVSRELCYVSLEVENMQTYITERNKKIKKSVNQANQNRSKVKKLGKSRVARL